MPVFMLFVILGLVLLILAIIVPNFVIVPQSMVCLLYTSDAADEL